MCVVGEEGGLERNRLEVFARVAIAEGEGLEEIVLGGDGEAEADGVAEFSGEAGTGFFEVGFAGGEDEDAVDEADGQHVVAKREVGGHGVDGLGVDADDVEVDLAGA